MDDLEQNANRLTITKAIDQAKEARKKYESLWNKINNQMLGSSYDGKARGMTPMRNYPYLFTTTFLPLLISRLPEVRINPERGYMDADCAESLRAAIEIVMRRQNALEEFRRAVQDGFYSMMILKTGLVPSTAASDPLHRGTDLGRFYGDSGGVATNMPFVKQVSPFRFLWDDSAGSFTQSAYMGEEFTRDRDSVLADPRYDPVALEEISGKAVVASRDSRDKFGASDDDIAHFRLIELYVRPTRRIYTIAELSEGDYKILREEDFWGPETGPYHMAGFLAAPEKVVPLSPLVAAWKLIQELEKNELRMNEDAQAEKRVAASNDAGAAKKFKDAKANDLIVLTGDSKIQEIQVGGFTAERAAYVDRLNYLTEIVTTVDAHARGMSTGGSSTATATVSRDNNTTNRISDMRNRVAGLIGEVVRDWVWYVMNDPSVKVAGETKSPSSGMRYPIIVEGGPQVDPMTGMPDPMEPEAEDFSVTVDEDSLHLSKDEIRAQQTLAQVTFLTGPYRQFLMSQGMDINAWAITRDLARKTNQPDLPNWVMPISPIAMQIMQMGEANQPEKKTEAYKTIGEGVQSGIMNSPETNAAISNTTSLASPARQAATPFGSNNVETSGGY